MRKFANVEYYVGFFKNILPRMDETRGFMNFAGSAFKILFGTATIADLENLYNTVQKLHEISTLSKRTDNLYEAFRRLSLI
jgi:hypothetical protein